jgi:hypothetical protein
MRWVHHLIDNGSWDETAVRRYFYPCDASEIFKIKLLPSSTPDFVAWHYEKNGLFSVRSAYRLAVWNQYGVGQIGSSSVSEQGRVAWKKVWSVKVPSKVNVFIWKIVNNGLPTRVNKKYRHLEQEDICELCGLQAEDAYHAVIRCPHAAALRLAMRDHCSLPPEQDLIWSGPEWLLQIVLNYPMEVLASFFLLIWHIWNIRNKIKHEEASVCIGSSVIFLNRYMHSLFTIRQQGDPLDNKGKRSLIPSMCKRKDPAANRV